MAQPTNTAAPHGYHTINPYLTVADVPTFIEFLQRTFDGVETEKIMQPDGGIAYTEVRVGDSLLMVGAPEVGSPRPSNAEPRPGTFYVYVADVDETYQRAMACGASSWEVPTERFYGDRVAAVVDTNNNVWWIATKKRTLSPEEVQARANRRWRSD